MSYRQEGYIPGSVAEATVSERLDFIRKTYMHLLAAALAFVLMSWVFFEAGVGRKILEFVGASRSGWLLILGGFMVVGWLASSMASRGDSTMSYLGLGVYVLAQALIFSPVILIAALEYPGVLPQAAMLTMVGFGALSFYVFTTKKDFSYLGPALGIIGIVALGAIVFGVLFQFSMGTWFSALMILFACGAILYSTSNVLHKYRTGQHVAAALELFAAVALLFWYVLRLLMGARR